MVPAHHAFPGSLTLVLADALLQLLNNSIHGCPRLSVGGAGGNGVGLSNSPRIFVPLSRAKLRGEQVSSSLTIYRVQRQTMSQRELYY